VRETELIAIIVPGVTCNCSTLKQAVVRQAGSHVDTATSFHALRSAVVARIHLPGCMGRKFVFSPSPASFSWNIYGSAQPLRVVGSNV